MRCRVWFAAIWVALWAAVAAASQEVQLAVVFTSDVHAHLVPYDEVRQRSLRGSLAQVATLVRKVREQYPLSLVLDGGDTIQGTPLAHYALSGQMGNGTDPTVAAMNLVGYDAAVLGNHEFDYGLPPLRRALQQSRFPWLAANVERSAEAQLPVKPWVIKTVGPVRVGIIGLTNPNIPSWIPPEHWAPLVFQDPVRQAEALIREVRPKVDLLVVVAHTGFERDLETGEPNGTDRENFAWRLSRLAGVDLLLTGHTHRDIPPRKVNGTWVAQPGRWAELATVWEIVVRREGRRFRVDAVNGRNVPVADLEPDPRVLDALAPLVSQVKAELERPLGRLVEPLRVGGVPVEDDPGLDLIHRVQLWATGADLSLAAPLTGSPVEFPAGPLTPRLAHALYVYANSLVVVRVTGAQLKAILEHAVRGWVSVRCGSGGALELLRDESLPSYNYDTVEGARYLVDPTAPEGQRVRWLEVRGQPVEAGDSFTLAVNSYRAAGGGGYPFLREAPRVRVVNRQVVDLLVEYLAKVGTLRPEASNNWFFAPRMVLAPAAQR